MKAVYYDEFAKPPRIEEVRDPTPSDRGVVVEVQATGVCRSDWHGWMGHDPDIVLPHVPGHELAGVISEIGKEVRRWKVGDRVTVPFVSGCGGCPECESGNPQVCRNQFQPGFTAWGSFAEYVALDYADLNLVALPESLDSATGACLGCRFVTSFRAVVDQGRVKSDEWVAVHGCGGVGLSAIMIANALGAKVVAVDIDQEKLDLAREVGAQEAVDGSSLADVPSAIHEITRGGAHLSIDALGHPTTCANSILSLRRRGRHVQVGLLWEGATLPMSRIVAHELEVIGSHGIQASRYGALLELIRKGTLDPKKLVGKRISLEDAPEALVDMASFHGVGITVICST